MRSFLVARDNVWDGVRLRSFGVPHLLCLLDVACAPLYVTPLNTWHAFVIG
jgi:hypothetical protein